MSLPRQGTQQLLARAGSLASKVEPHITAMSNSAQLRYILWIDKAKKPETRGRRIAEAVRHLIQEAD
jgi:uncharacterized protein YdeI (YjbR/CyaY-like superfamily)